MKRFFALFLILTLFSVPICVKGETEAVYSADFESGSLSGWQMLNGVFEASKERPYEGNYSMKIQTSAGKANSYATVPVSILPDTSYTVSFYVRGGGGEDGTYPALKLEYFDLDNKYNSAYDVQEVFSDVLETRWIRKSVKFKTPSAVSKVAILLRAYGVAPLYFDNITITGEGAEKPEPAAPKPAEGLKERVEGTEDLIVNGGFEEIDSETGGPKGWTVYQGDWDGNKYVQMGGDTVYKGEQAVKVETSSGGNPWVCQHIKNLEPTAQYQFTAWINSFAISGNGIAVKMEFYSGDEITVDTNVANLNTEYMQSTDGQWVQISHTFTAPANARSVAIYPRLYANGMVYFDDISMVKIQNAPRAYLDTDNVFYYSDWTEGVATTQLNTEAYGDEAGDLIDFRLSFGDELLDEKQNVSAADAQYQFDLSLLSEKQQPYTVSAVIKDQNGNELDTIHKSIYKYDRPGALTSDGTYMKDGKPFDPVIGYHVLPDKHFQVCAETGVNVVQGYNTTNVADYLAFLDLAHSKGLMVLVTLYNGMKPAGNPDNIEVTRNIVAAVKDHPAVFAYAVMDEPAYNLINYEQDLEDSYRAIRDIDPYHPVFIVECEKDHFKTVGKYVDIMAIDPYPSNRFPKGTYCTDMMNRANKGVNYKKPVYSILQTFTYGGYFPTANDIRHMAYESFLLGAKGIGYFCFSEAYGFQTASTKVDLNETDVWPELVTAHAEEYPDAFDHFSRGNGPVFCDGINDNIIWHGWIKDGKLRLLVLNRTEVTINADIPLVSNNKRIEIGGYQAEVIAGSKAEPFRGESAKLSIPLAPLQTILFQITPDQEINQDMLQGDRFDDLSEAEWAKREIEFLDHNGIVNTIGESSFRPNEKITRADFGMFLIRTFGISGSGEKGFQDIPQDAYYSKEIMAGKENGIFLGDDSGSFRPLEEISRQDMLVMCARALDWYRQSEKQEGLVTLPTQFEDYEMISDYALDGVVQMAELGIVKGDENGRIRPFDHTTRAEAAMIMYRLFDFK